MYAELGHFALTLALAVALVQATLPHWGARRGDRALMALAPSSALLGFTLVALAFVCLVAGYLRSDFSIANVWENSHSAKPLIYKISGTWGNHEGSMLLWVMILGLCAALVALFGANLPERLHARVLAIQGALSALFLAFILFTSNPFLRLFPPPAEGRDLNPVLQDPGLAIHPPLLYVGYVGFSIAFSFAVAALIEGRIDAAWARWVRPWSLLSWIFLTLGIAMGSYWAYYELGWGGWWFWDPVENASFMPWLAGTALVHSAIVMEKRDALKIWTVLLAILTFALSLLGTFLVRSGVLTSVHTFATDPARGVFILAILALVVGGSFLLFALRAGNLRQGGLFAPISREGALVFNNLILAAACGAVFVGTLYPLALEGLTGAKISVGAPFFNMTFIPLMVPLVLALPFGPMLPWKRGDLFGAAQRLSAAAALALVAALALYALEGGSLGGAAGIGLGIWLIAGTISELIWRSRLGRVPLTETGRRLANLQRSSIGMMLAHAGLGVTLIGIAAVASSAQEKIIAMKPGESIEIAGRTLRFEGMAPRRGPNYRDLVGHFVVREGDRVVAEIDPAKRIFVASGRQTTEAGIRSFVDGDLYVSLGDAAGTDAIVVRTYYKPLIPLIWLGAVIMALGGAFSLSDRRFRVGAPRRAAARLAPAE
ncbi:MAG: heme lyase CcmF/NrfE family subunit [Flavobacteriaceae bacterium]